jgi:hypothetical protein
MMYRLHPLAGATALGLIALFWLSTVISELSGSPGAIVTVRHGIVLLLPVLIAAMIATGISGGRIASGRMAIKRRRMMVIAANGVLVLVPCALVLRHLALGGRFDTVFAAIQALELVAGAANMTLMALNLRDGLRLRRKGPSLAAG